MMSYQDVMIICSDLPVGKPLCMCRRTGMVHLHIHRHPCRNPKYYESSKPFCLFPNAFSMPVTYIRSLSSLFIISKSVGPSADSAICFPCNCLLQRAFYYICSFLFISVVTVAHISSA